MADLAAHLVDRVLPEVPVRQWVLSLPIRLRYLLAFDRELCRRIRNVFVRAVLGWLKRRARRAGIMDPETGAVTAVQRFGSALNLNVHFHTLALDGVFHCDKRRPGLNFEALPAPTEEALARLLARIRSRTLAVIRRCGFAPEELHMRVDPLPMDSETLAACAAASLQRRVALGPCSGDRIPRRRDPTRAMPYRFPKDGCVDSQGFSLHADLRVAARDRQRLERLCRYLVRPPVSDTRLSLTGDGRIAVQLKTPYDDGTTHFLFDPMTFLERLAALVPPPRAHLVVYHGVLSSASSLRPDVIPRRSRPPTTCRDAEAGPAGHSPHRRDTDDRSVRPRNYSWAELMKRVFLVDVLHCPCGGERRILAAITEAPVIRAILRALDLPDEPPVRGWARAPPDGPGAVIDGHTEIRLVLE